MQHANRSAIALSASRRPASSYRLGQEIRMLPLTFSASDYDNGTQQGTQQADHDLHVQPLATPTITSSPPTSSTTSSDILIIMAIIYIILVIVLALINTNLVMIRRNGLELLQLLPCATITQLQLLDHLNLNLKCGRPFQISFSVFDISPYVCRHCRATWELSAMQHANRSAIALSASRRPASSYRLGREIRMLPLTSSASDYNNGTQQGTQQADHDLHVQPLATPTITSSPPTSSTTSSDILIIVMVIIYIILVIVLALINTNLVTLRSNGLELLPLLPCATITELQLLDYLNLNLKMGRPFQISFSVFDISPYVCRHCRATWELSAMQHANRSAIALSASRRPASSYRLGQEIRMLPLTSSASDYDNGTQRQGTQQANHDLHVQPLSTPTITSSPPTSSTTSSDILIVMAIIYIILVIVLALINTNLVTLRSNGLELLPLLPCATITQLQLLDHLNLNLKWGRPFQISFSVFDISPYVCRHCRATWELSAMQHANRSAIALSASRRPASSYRLGREIRMLPLTFSASDYDNGTQQGLSRQITTCISSPYPHPP